MEGKITQLTERGTGAPLYPITSAEAVVMSDGRPGQAAISEAGIAAFVKLWITCGGEYNPTDAPDPEHTFYLNTLWLTYEEALEIYTISAGVNIDALDNNPRRATFMRCKCRTLLPLITNTPWVSIAQLFNDSDIEVIRLCKRDSVIPRGSTYAAFTDCRKLKKIMTRMNYFSDYQQSTFKNCVSLEEVELETNASINFKDSPKLSLKSIEFVIKHSQNGSTVITITLHPDAYARVTEDMFEEAANRNITIATP